MSGSTPMNLPPAATPWGRRVNETTQELQSRVDRLGQAVSAPGAGRGGVRIVSEVTDSISNNGTSTGTMSFARSGRLVEYMVNHSAHLRVYSRQSDIALDLGRPKGVSPMPGISLVLEWDEAQPEFSTINGTAGLGAPFVNLDTPQAGALHYWIRNESGSDRSIQFTLKWVSQ